jgi:hypothetical protein
MPAQPTPRAARERRLVVAELPSEIREELYVRARAAQLPVSEVIRRGVVAALALLAYEQRRDR